MDPESKWAGFIKLLICRAAQCLFQALINKEIHYWLPVYQVHLPYSCTLKVYGYFLSAAPNPLNPPPVPGVSMEKDHHRNSLVYIAKFPKLALFSIF